MNKIIAIAVLLVFAVAGFLANYFLLERNNETFIVDKFQFNEVRVDLAAVLDDNSGQLFPLTITAQGGSGNIYIDIDDPTFITDTQHSARIAADEAERITSFDFSKIDILLSMDTGQTIVAGPSAGAAMTVGIIATVLNKQIKEDIAITGTIEKGGAVGPVGGILQKAQGAKAAGKKVLLVPKGEAIVQEAVQTCKELSTNIYSKSCVVTYKTMNVQDAVGIQIIEVTTVEDAMKLMLV